MGNKIFILIKLLEIHEPGLTETSNSKNNHDDDV